MSDDSLGAWLREDDRWVQGAQGSSTEAWGPTGDPKNGGERGDDDTEATGGTGTPFLWGPEEEPRRGSRLRRLMAAPWILAAVLAVVAIVGRGGGPAADTPLPARERTPDTPATPETVESAASAGEGAGGAAAGDDRLSKAIGDDGLRAAAAVAVRSQVSGPIAGAGDPPDRVRYVDLAVGESVTWVGDVAVVTVAAVVLDGAAGHWQDAQSVRYAVPLQRRDGGVVTLGRPWAVPMHAAAPPPRSWQPVAAPELAEPVLGALAGAGYNAVGGVELSRDPELAGVLRARVEAVAPGEGSARLHELWLRDGPSPTLLGLPGPTSAAPSPDDGRSGEPAAPTQAGRP